MLVVIGGEGQRLELIEIIGGLLTYTFWWYQWVGQSYFLLDELIAAFAPFFLHIYQVICCLTAVSFFRLVVKTVDYEDEEDAERWGLGRPDIMIIIIILVAARALVSVWGSPREEIIWRRSRRRLYFQKNSKTPKSITISTRLLAMPASFSTRTANVSLSSALVPSSARTCRLARGCGAQLQRGRWWR